VTLAIDAGVFGERRRERLDAKAKKNLQADALAGQVLWGMMMFDELARSVTASRPEVDPARLGAFGSLWGPQSLVAGRPRFARPRGYGRLLPD